MFFERKAALVVFKRSYKQPMLTSQKKLILWTGNRHSGKTTRAAYLAREAYKTGFNVAGLLAPSLYHNSTLIGFDAFDLKNNSRTPLARRNHGETQTRQFKFIPEGLQFGYLALSEKATKSVDLIIVDEFGPLELDGRIWRKNVDSLLSRSNSTILLVVRQELVKTVRRLYKDIFCRELAANEPESISTVIDILKKHRQLHRAGK